MGSNPEEPVWFQEPCTYCGKRPSRIQYVRGEEEMIRVFVCRTCDAETKEEKDGA